MDQREHTFELDSSDSDSSAEFVSHVHRNLTQGPSKVVRQDDESVENAGEDSLSEQAVQRPGSGRSEQRV